MHRLLQGDVGSGKTVVAVSALLVAVRGRPPGRARWRRPRCWPSSTRSACARCSTASRCRRRQPARRASVAGRPAHESHDADGAASGCWRASTSGETDILIGTHALIEEGVAFRSLGVVVVDEQHRFGVEQRAALREKGAGEVVPDVLVMTATPIPRTAAMTVYGDLDVSVLDEMPPGREPIATSWEKVQPRRPDARASSRCGRRCARRSPPDVRPTSCARSSRSPRSSRSARPRRRTTSCHATSSPDLRLALLHGRMTSGEKEKTMTLFRSGAIDVLVSTTVIEVGVDVPERDGHGDPRRRPVRHRAAPPAARSRRPRRRARVVVRPRRRRRDTRGGGAVAGAGADPGRLRAGRGRPRHPGRGHDHGRAPEGPQRPEARVAATRPRMGRAGAGGGDRARRRRPRSVATTRSCSPRSKRSSTTKTASSSSRADPPARSGVNQRADM